MSLKSANKIETNTHQLEIEISAETFNEAVNKAYLKERGKISIP